MSLSNIYVVDIGVGNVHAIINILKKINIEFNTGSNLDDIQKASHIILPGVGGFSDFITKLKEKDLLDFLTNFHNYEDKFLLGICIGMQVLGDASDEGEGNGLSLIPGSIKLIEDNEVKIPHMGWNSIKVNGEYDIFKGIDMHTGFYFLHSFFFAPFDNSHTISNFEYNSKPYPAFIKYKNVYGSQGHPEKSHDNGSMLLKNFCELTHA